MRFKVTTAADRYEAKDVARLAAIGFEFSDPKEPHRGFLGSGWRYKTGPVGDTRNPTVWVNIETLEELMAFSREHGAIIVDRNQCIEIYDDNRE